MILDMVQLLVQLDEETSERLERVASGKSRKRSEFIRMAIRKALWDYEEQITAQAYAKQPDTVEAYFDGKTWEPAVPGRRRKAR